MLNHRQIVRANKKITSYLGLKLLKVIILVLTGFPVLGQQQAEGRNAVNVTLPPIALIDIEPAGQTIELAFDSPLQAGYPIVAGAASMNNELWLNYTSAITANGPSRNVSAQIDAGNLPSGIRLKLVTGSYSGAGEGATGIPSGEISLSTVPQSCISGIRGAFTGDGVGNGHQLTYLLEIEEYGQLFAVPSADLVITYTITDN